MCDCSLHDVATRSAKVGDKLVTTQFTNSITRGFTGVLSAELTNTAVQMSAFSTKREGTNEHAD